MSLPERVTWESGEVAAAEDLGPFLKAQLGDHVVVGLQIQPNGDYTLYWTIVVTDNVTLPEVEDFMQRVGGFIEHEPVVP